MKLQWNQIDWKKAEEQVNRLQIRIVKATLEQKLRLVKRLQYLITNSFYAKALAVKRVVSNRGKKTPGIDGEFWKSDKEKVNAVRSLDCQTYHAKPLKRVYIEKFGKKEKRPLGIPTMRDRAMQALQLLALEPVAETTADRISFGFRKYRSPEDAREYAFSVLSRKDSPQWILEGDIKSCFDKISHRWMMDNIPGNKRIMKEFMRCGYVEKGKLYPTIEGSPQGGVLAMGNVELNQKVDNLDKKIEHLEYDLPILGIEIDRITAAAKKKGVECLGGKNSEAYADRSLRGKVYNDIYRELKRQFGVTTYKAIKRNQCDLAVEIISGYQLPYVLADQVQYRNAQGNLWGGVRA